MKPPYDLSPSILKLLTAVSEKFGEVQAVYLVKQSWIWSKTVSWTFHDDSLKTLNQLSLEPIFPPYILALR